MPKAEVVPTVSATYLAQNLAAILEDALCGETVIITRNGRAVAEIRPPPEELRAVAGRRDGLWPESSFKLAPAGVSRERS